VYIPTGDADRFPDETGYALIVFGVVLAVKTWLVWRQRRIQENG